MKDWAPAWKSISQAGKAEFKEKAKEKPKITVADKKKLLKIIG